MLMGDNHSLLRLDLEHHCVAHKSRVLMHCGRSDPPCRPRAVKDQIMSGKGDEIGGRRESSSCPGATTDLKGKTKYPVAWSLDARSVALGRNLSAISNHAL
jgi:hypothetical protein